MKMYIIQTVAAFAGAFGFAFLFNIKGYKLIITGVGGSLSWIIYLVLNYLGMDQIVSLFGASAFVMLLAEILARVIKTPTIILLVPMLIPLIPGGDLYYTMFHLVSGNSEEFISYLSLTMKEAASISLGIIIVTSLVSLINRVQLYINRK